MAYGHTYAHYLPEQDFPEWCQGTVMSYFFPCGDERLHPRYPRVFQVPNFSNPDVFYPRRKGMDPSHPDVPMGVPGDEPTMSSIGPANAARVIDELWDIVANLSEPPFERLAGACNEGDMAPTCLTSRLPARAVVMFAGGGRTYRLPVSGPAACLDDVALKGRSSDATFDVATTDRSGGEHRLSVVATEPAHFGACVSSKRAVVTAELWDAVEEFPPAVIRQRVPGVSPGHLLVEQRSAHSFCKGAPDRHHLRRLGDFDGDGRADALLRHADGHWHFYPLDEDGAVSGPASRVTRSPTVGVAGVGDFNGDGQDDLLMRRAKGSWYHYPMNNGRVSGTGQGEVALPHDLGWAVEGIGDNNGDLQDDVLLRHVDGRLQWHHMDGGTVLDVGTSFGWRNTTTATKSDGSAASATSAERARKYCGAERTEPGTGFLTTTGLGTERFRSPTTFRGPWPALRTSTAMARTTCCCVTRTAAGGTTPWTAQPLLKQLFPRCRRIPWCGSPALATRMATGRRMC